MWFFLTRYKKVMVISIIPIIVIVALIGVEVTRGDGDRSKPLSVNKEMQAMLEGNEKKLAPPSAAETPPPISAGEQLAGGAKAAVVSPDPEIPNVTAEAIQPMEEPTSASNPEKPTKPKKTAKPKGTSKPNKQQSLNLKVNINKASIEELIQLKGIGESKANAILAYRAEHSFQTVEELMKVKGIGPKIFENIKAQLEL